MLNFHILTSIYAWMLLNYKIKSFHMSFFCIIDIISPIGFSVATKLFKNSVCVDTKRTKIIENIFLKILIFCHILVIFCLNKVWNHLIRSRMFQIDLRSTFFIWFDALFSFKNPNQTFFKIFKWPYLSSYSFP